MITPYEPLLCMICGEEKTDALEFDHFTRETWNYCRACDVWTCHPPAGHEGGLSTNRPSVRAIVDMICEDAKGRA